jgi:ketopantoate reductase
LAGGADISPNNPISKPRLCSSTVSPRVLAGGEHDGTGSQGLAIITNAGGTAVLSLQNGVDNEEKLARRLGRST